MLRENRKKLRGDQQGKNQRQLLKNALANFGYRLKRNHGIKKEKRGRKLLRKTQSGKRKRSTD